jgi:hypothetical protein
MQRWSGMTEHECTLNIAREAFEEFRAEPRIEVVDAGDAVVPLTDYGIRNKTCHSTLRRLRDIGRIL